MEEIRSRAVRGLHALPRFGIGIGGLLLGVKEGGVVRILDSQEIPCSHALGPSFILTPDEKRFLQEMVHAGNPLTVVGWYCSKTRGDLVLGDQDRKIFEEMFPERWQIALLLKPGSMQPSRAAIVYRDRRGAKRTSRAWELLPWREDLVRSGDEDSDPSPVVAAMRLAPDEPADAPVLRAMAALPTMLEPDDAELQDDVEPQEEREPQQQVQPQQTAPLVAARSTYRFDPAPRSATPEHRPIVPQPVESPRTRTDPVEQYLPDLPESPRRSRRRAGWLLAATAVLAASLLAVATRDSWWPKPPLALDVSEVNGILLFRWNSEALKGAEGGVLAINDGGQQQTIPVDHTQLVSGHMAYDRNSDRVTARLGVGEISAVTSFAGPLPKSKLALQEKQRNDEAERQRLQQEAEQELARRRRIERRYYSLRQELENRAPAAGSQRR
jgi:hypothetical protein